jgi:flagellar biosynthesis protein FlhG
MSEQLDSLRHYVAHHPPVGSPEAPPGVLLVAGGKGGVGTSTVAGLLAVMAAMEGIEVLLVDADESHGSLPLLLGVEPVHPLERLRGGEVVAEDLLIPLGHGLAFLSAGGAADGGESLPPAERRALLRRLAALYPRFGLVVVEAGSRLASVLPATQGASRLLAVTAAERIAAAATFGLIKAVDARAPHLPVDLIVNRSPLPTARMLHLDIEGGTRRFLNRSLGFGGAIPEDDRLTSALQSGLHLHQAAALGTPAASACHELAARLVNLVAAPALPAPRVTSRR